MTAFHFVGGASAGEFRHRRTRADRQHVARVNRQKRKAGAAGPDAFPLVQHTKQRDKRRNILKFSSRECATSYEDPAASLFDHGSFEPETSWKMVSDLSLAATPVLEFPPSPVMGAMAIESFSIKDAAANTARMQRYLQIIDNGALQPDDRTTWFATFCQNQLVWHCVSYVVNAFEEMIDGANMRPSTLMHRGEIIRMANMLLANQKMIDSQAEPLFLAVATLFAANPRSVPTNYAARSMFSPYVPYDTAVSSMDQDGLHIDALAWMIKRIGGFDRLTQLPSFGKVLAYTIAIYASAHARKPPLMLCSDSLHVDAIAVLEGGSMEVFPRHLGLPLRAVVVFDAIRLLDKRFEERQTNIFQLRNILNHSQLQLLSMPHWTRLDTDEQTCPEAVYETCRITSIIYSNAVLMAPGFNSPWVSINLAALDEVLKGSHAVDWQDAGAQRMLSWSLFVAAMTAWHTPLRSHFLKLLKGRLDIARLITWQQLSEILQEFLWSDTACDEGASVVWNAIEREK